MNLDAIHKDQVNVLHTTDFSLFIYLFLFFGGGLNIIVAILTLSYIFERSFTFNVQGSGPRVVEVCSWVFYKSFHALCRGYLRIPSVTGSQMLPVSTPQNNVQTYLGKCTFSILLKAITNATYD